MENSSPIWLYCPNCGKKVVGYKGIDGAVRIKCSNCLVSIFSKQKSKQEINIKVISKPTSQTI